MVPLTPDDLAQFRAAHRVVLTEDNGVQTVACHVRPAQRGAQFTTHELTIHRIERPAANRSRTRSVSLTRPQMAAWQHLSNQLRAGDRLSLRWEDHGRLRSRTAVHVLVSRDGRLRRFPLGTAGQRGEVRLRPGRIALVAIAALGLWWLARNAPALAVLAATLLVLSLVVRRRRARDGWPLGTLRILRVLVFVAVTVFPLVITALLIAGIVYGCLVGIRWARRTFTRAPGAWQDSPRAPGSRNGRAERSWRNAPRGRATVLDLEPDAHGVHRTRGAHGNGKVVRLVPANSREVVASHVDTAAKVLDVVGPTWDTIVDLDGLARADDPGGFILEAAFGAYDDGLNAVVEHLDSRRQDDETPEERTRSDALEDCVRAALTGDNCAHLANRSERDMRALRDAWCDELRRRVRDGAPAS